MEAQASIRSQLYAALAQAFRKPEAAPEKNEEDSLIQVLQQAAVAYDAQALGQIADEVIGSLEIPEDQAEQALRTLEIEYNRLFVGPGRPQVPPYESVYRDARGLVMGPAAREVERRYSEAGLALEPGYHDLPDHVATELGFMAYLAMQEAEARDEERRTWLERERWFLQDHLSVWLPLFCRRVRETSQHPFYTALAELTETFFSLDTQWSETYYESQPEGAIG
jgi:DMSO reductase family type II enzyme chaperone